MALNIGRKSMKIEKTSKISKLKRNHGNVWSIENDQSETDGANFWYFKLRLVDLKTS